MINVYLLIFLLFAVTFSLSTLIESYYPYSWLLKAIPVSALAIYFYSQFTNTQQTKTHVFFLCGLGMSVVGDIVLALEQGQYFVFGLAAFFVAHVFYIMSLYPVAPRRLPIVIAYAVIGVGTFSLMAPWLGELFIPVFFYILILLTMAVFSVISQRSNRWLIVGAALFVISDSIIGLNKFYQPIPYNHILIMLTYYSAQFALTLGMLKALKKQ